jgi:hypothetical protein
MGARGLLTVDASCTDSWKDLHLHELAHPWHLVVDSQSFGRCIEHSHGNVALTDIQRLPELPHWAEIAVVGLTSTVQMRYVGFLDLTK